MGACSSVVKGPSSAMKLRLSFSSKTDSLVNPSPVNDQHFVGIDRPIADGSLKSQWSPAHPVTVLHDSGTKEDAFFDSQPWLESDCEDDFLSVKGDFTPSRGTTPVHHSFSVGALQANRAPLDEKSPLHSPTDMKKRLMELFRGSLGGNRNLLKMEGNQNGANRELETETVSVHGLPLKAADASTPFVSGANSDVCNSERIPFHGEERLEKQKSLKSVQCCLPRLRSGRSFNGRKKIMSPPPQTIKA